MLNRFQRARKTRISPRGLIIICLLTGLIYGQQIEIERVEQMPNLPQPYEMRDWRQVARGYDSLVFDYNATGQYLPLIWTDGNTVNYPDHDRFGLHTVVGTPYSHSAEAINCIPAVIGATLVGIDKSNQDGKNYVLMCEEWFNRRPEENIYLNGFVANSGSDWWYETMPNVFFYQLYDLYPHIGDFDRQLVTVADRWLQVVYKLGGSTKPWKKPNMNYRAFNFSTMKPLSEGVRQPEAAGAIAWILYNAFVETGDDKYRIGAELALEFLNEWTTNPSYELQLPYGVYTAARMNAELGTNYDIEKLLNWCFTPEGNVRQWGVTLGNWGGYDCDGLVGEALYDGYAFIMNGFEQAGALAPMVRYDERFALAIGKWMLNCANASRLFYTNYLPDANQDSEGWAHQYDPNGYIAHESMREYALYTGISPYATGDAIRGGWGETNLALYGSSHVGIFGGIIDTTNIEGILKLDLLKTDYFQNDAYPAYLYYNPYDTLKVVHIDAGGQSVDFYDMLENQVIKTNVSGTDSFMIAGDAVLMLALIPAGAVLTQDLNNVLANGIIIDYSAGQASVNYPPRIKSLDTGSDIVMINGAVNLYCAAEDRENATLIYNWHAQAGTFSGSGGQVGWTAPDSKGDYNILCIVEDDQGAVDSASVVIEVTDNHIPQITGIAAAPPEVELGMATVLTCSASDSDEDSLIFNWTAAAGSISGSGPEVAWTAPQIPGYYHIYCTVSDQKGGSVTDSIGISAGSLVMHLAFSGNAHDSSGFGNHGSVTGAALTTDRQGLANSAFSFDGLNDLISVDSHPSLNFQHGITVHLWMMATEIFDTREAYPISHGNWEERWKISVTDGGIRWTVKTDDGIRNLDSDTKLSENEYYCITCTYDGAAFLIYVNGTPDNSSTHSGDILKTNIDLSVGQHLPSASGFNFKGVIDEVRVYNRALAPDEVKTLYDTGTAISGNSVPAIPRHTALLQNYPNPFNSSTKIRYQLSAPEAVKLSVMNILGQRIMTLENKSQPAGHHTVIWNGKNDRGQSVNSGVYFVILEAGDVQQRIKLIYLK